MSPRRISGERSHPLDDRNAFSLGWLARQSVDCLRLIRSVLQFFRQPGGLGGIDRLRCLHFLKHLFRRPRVCAALLQVADNPTLPHQVFIPLGKVGVYLHEVSFKSTSFHGHQPRQ